MTGFPRTCGSGVNGRAGRMIGTKASCTCIRFGSLFCAPWCRIVHIRALRIVLPDLVCSSEAWATAVPPGLKCVRPRAHVGLSSGSENMSRCLECLMHRDKDLLDSVDAGRFLTKNYKVLKLVRLRLSIIIKVLEVMSNPRH